MAVVLAAVTQNWEALKLAAEKRRWRGSEDRLCLAIHKCWAVGERRDVAGIAALVRLTRGRTEKDCRERADFLLRPS